MQLGQLVTEILDELNKGSSITATQVKSKVRDAIQTLEGMISWEYMDRLVTFTIDPEATTPRALPMPPGLKSIEFFRIIKSSGKFHYLREIDPKDMTKVGTCIADGYFKDGMQYLWLDNTPDQTYNGEMSYRQFTVWDESDSFEPWLLQQAFPLVRYQTLVLLAPFVREPELMKLWSALYTTELKIWIDANEELAYSNKPLSMEYSN